MASPTTSNFVTRRSGTAPLKVDFARFSVHAPRADSLTPGNDHAVTNRENRKKSEDDDALQLPS